MDIVKLKFSHKTIIFLIKFLLYSNVILMTIFDIIVIIYLEVKEGVNE